MSEVISLSTFHNHNLTDQDHALFMQTVTSQSGLFYGCEVTLKDENTLHVSTGEGIACGRLFRIMDMDYPVELSASGDLLGRLYVHIDTALDDTPAQLMDVQGSTLPALIQEDDMNQSTGVYEIELATFSINELGISNLEFTAPKATGGGAGGKSIAPDYSATESYEKGRIFFQNGTLYKTIAAIPAGAPLVVDTNVVETSLAAEIEALNQNLMQSLTYNENTKYYGSYFNGVWKNVLFYDPEAPDCEVEYMLNDGSSSTTAQTHTYNVHKNGVYAIIKGGANSASGMSISLNGTILFSNSYYTVARMNAGDQVSVRNTVTGNYKYGFGVVYLGSVGSSITNITSSIGTSTPYTGTFNATNANTVCILLSNMAASVATGTNIEVSGASADGTLSYKQMRGVANIACMAYRKNPLNGAVTMTATYSQGYHASHTIVQFNIE